jgi:hypothetical protein
MRPDSKRLISTGILASTVEKTVVVVEAGEAFPETEPQCIPASGVTSLVIVQ